MTRLILIRHGQSLANANNLFAGHSDFDLSDFGKQQARLAASYLRKKESLDAIYASDLLRAYHTATPIGEAFGIPVIKDTGFREIYAGEWESLSFDDIATRYAASFSVWKNDYSHARPVGGESTEEVYRRVVPHVKELAQKHDGGTILIASHATVVRAVEACAGGYRADETGKVSFCYNASINIYSYENGTISPIESNIIEHLGDQVTYLPKIINA